MNTLKHSWMILLALFAAVNTGVAGTVIWPGLSGKDTTPQLVKFRVTADHHIETRSVKIPSIMVDKIAARAVKVSNHHGQALQLKEIHLRGDQVVVVGQRLLFPGAHLQRQPSYWLQEVRVTFPRYYLASSWDVQSLQRELERLGIKIKPKPAEPKPTQQLSG